MAYTPVPEAIDGQTAPAADWWNKYIRDNMAAGVPGLMTTKGDIVAATGVDASARVPVGSNGAMLYADDGAPAGVTFSLRNKVKAKGDTSDQVSVPTSAWTKIVVFDSEDFDVASAFADNKFTCQHTGFYVVGLSGVRTVSLTNTNLDWYVQVAIYKNGSLYSVIGMTHDGTRQSTNFPFQGIDMLPLAYGDYVEAYFYEYSNGIGLVISADPNWAQFYVSEIG